MIKCQGCDEIKEESLFPVRNDRSGRLRPYCKECKNNIERNRYNYHKKTNPFRHKYSRTKSRALALKVPFNLTPEYLESIWTGFCPVLKKEIYLYEKDRNDELAAELDRMVPSLGYVIGNVNFISRRVNRQKNSTSIEELESLLEWMKNDC